MTLYHQPLLDRLAEADADIDRLDALIDDASAPLSALREELAAALFRRAERLGALRAVGYDPDAPSAPAEPTRAPRLTDAQADAIVGAIAAQPGTLAELLPRLRALAPLTDKGLGGAVRRLAESGRIVRGEERPARFSVPSTPNVTE